MADNSLSLSQAAQAPDITGALQQLLMSRVPTPEQERWQKQARYDTMQDYQNALRAPVNDGFSPMMYSLGAATSKFRPGVHPFYAAAQGVQEGNNFMLQREQQQRLGDIAAAKVGYENAKDEDKMSLLELSALKGLAGRGGAGGGSFIQFKDDNGNLYIMNKATGQRETIPASHTKVWADAEKAGYEKAVAEGRENPAEYAVQYASWVVSQLPGAKTTVDTVQKPTAPVGVPGATVEPPMLTGSPVAKEPDNSKAGAQGFPNARSPETEAVAILQAEYAQEGQIIDQLKGNPSDPRYMQALRNQSLIMEELRRKGATGGSAAPVQVPAGATVAGQGGLNTGTVGQGYSPPQRPATAPQNGAPAFTYKNQPVEKGAIAGSEAMNKTYAADYTAVQDQASSAETQYEAFNAMEKIDPKVDLFNRPKAFVGSVLNAFGVDPNSPSVRSAIERREVEQLLSSMSNAFLRGEKGVQTKSDEERIKAELPKLGDTKEAWDVMVKVGKERAKRKMEMLKFYDKVAEGNNGVPIRARASWEKEYRNDPLTSYHGGQLITRSQYIDAFLATNKGAQESDAVSAWRNKEAQYMSRGGKK